MNLTFTLTGKEGTRQLLEKTWFSTLSSVQDLFWEQSVDFPTLIRDGILDLDLVMSNRQGLVAEISLKGYIAPGAVHQMLSVDQVLTITQRSLWLIGARQT